MLKYLKTVTGFTCFAIVATMFSIVLIEVYTIKTAIVVQHAKVSVESYREFLKLKIERNIFSQFLIYIIGLSIFYFVLEILRTYSIILSKLKVVFLLIAVLFIEKLVYLFFNNRGFYNIFTAYFFITMAITLLPVLLINIFIWNKEKVIKTPKIKTRDTGLKKFRKLTFSIIAFILIAAFGTALFTQVCFYLFFLNVTVKQLFLNGSNLSSLLLESIPYFFNQIKFYSIAIVIFFVTLFILRKRNIIFSKTANIILLIFILVVKKGISYIPVLQYDVFDSYMLIQFLLLVVNALLINYFIGDKLNKIESK